MNRKGQASIEFILLIILMLLYVQTIILPAIDMSKSSVKGTMGLGEAVFAGEKIANAINYVGSGSGEGKETISVYLPAESTISCAKSQPGVSQQDIVRVKYTLTFETDNAHCDSATGVCTKDIGTFVNFDCPSALQFVGKDRGVDFIVQKTNGKTELKAA